MKLYMDEECLAMPRDASKSLDHFCRVLGKSQTKKSQQEIFQLS